MLNYEMGDVDVIKRPLVWILAAYLTGMYLAWIKLSILMVIISMCLCFLILYLFIFHMKIKIPIHRDRFLWCLPLLLFLGFLIMKQNLVKPELYNAFEQEVRCKLSGSITMIVEKQSGTTLYLQNNKVILPEGSEYLCENVIVYCPVIKTNVQNNSKVLQYLVGNKLTVKGTLQKFYEATNPGQFNEQQYYQIENIDFKLEADEITLTDTGYSRFHAALGRIKSKLIQVYSTILSDKESGTLIAMLLGEKYLLSDEIKELYQENGISHVLAISGLHVSLIGMFLFGLLKMLKLPIPFATLLSIFFIYSYGVLTNFSVSTNRAVVMMTILLLARLVGKTYDMLSAMALSALIILFQNPLQILSAGFLLSYGAVLGIAVLLPCLQQLFPSKNSFLYSLLISSSAQITTTPFVIYYFYQFPVYSIITNLIILPFVTVLTLTSILAGIAGAIYLPLGIFLIGGANYILKFYEGVCKAGSSLPGNLITVGKPDLLRLFMYGTLVIIFVWAARKYQKKYSILILLAAMLLLMLPQSNAGFEMTFLDVGQGDAIFMESESGTSYLVDGGSSDINQVGIYRLKPFLLSQGVDTLDYAIVTHTDKDHISGLADLMDNGNIKLKNLLLPNINNKDEAYIELEKLAMDKGINFQYIRAGDILLDGKLQIFCLHPGMDYEAATANAYSTVLSIRYGEFDMLLTGDLQKDGEKIITELIKSDQFWNRYQIRPSVTYDVLKVSHHGSKSSTFDDFLALIHPGISIISCGKDNFYGHPHRELLDRLNRTGSEIKITYETGAVIIRTDGKRFKIREYLKE